MGNTWKNKEKSREEVVSDIEKANKITKNDLFMKKTKISIEFELDIDPFLNIFSDNIIKATVYKYKNSLKYFHKKVKMNITEFYKFYEALMESTPIFYGDKLKERFSSGQTTMNDENGICPICEENKVSIMLDCYHFFCEKCIKTWLFDKKNSCPLCRFEIEINAKDNKITKAKHWDLIDGVDTNEYNSYVLSSFTEILKNTFINK